MSFDPNEPDVWGRTGQAKVDAAKQRGENVPEGFDYSRFDLSKALDTQGPSMPNLFPTSPASYSGSDTSPYSSIGYSSSSGGGTWIAIILILLAIGYFVGADAAVAAAGFMLGLMILGFGFFVLCKMLDIGVSIVKWVFRFLFPASLLAGLIYLVLPG